MGVKKTKIKQSMCKSLALHQTAQRNPKEARHYVAHPVQAGVTTSAFSLRAKTRPREVVLPTPCASGENRNSPVTQRSAVAPGLLRPCSRARLWSHASIHCGTFSHVKSALSETVLGILHSMLSP